MSQSKNILKHLKRKGSLTALDALNLYGVFRLAARINDLRNAGHAIKTTMIDGDNNKQFAKYHF